MLNILFGFLVSIRKGIQNLLGKLFSRFVDPNTNKFSGIAPKTLVKIFWVVGIVLFVSVLATRLVSGKKNSVDEVERLRKELTPLHGVNDVPPGFGNGNDPILQMLNENNPELPNVGGSGGKNDLMGGSSSGEPTKDECSLLMTRMQGGETLAGVDKVRMNACLSKNIAGWSNDQIKMADKLLNDDTLTDSEKKLLVKGINGTATPEEMAVLKALTSDDPRVRALAKEAIAQGAPGIAALANRLAGKDVVTERTILEKMAASAANALKDAGQSAALDSAIATGKKGLDALLAGTEYDAKNGISGSAGSDGKSGFGGAGAAGTNGLTPEQLAAMAAEIAKKEKEIHDQEQKVAEAQAASQAAANKIIQGQPLSPEEQKALAKLAELQQQLQKLKDQQNERTAELARQTSKFQKTLAEVAYTMNENVPSWSSVGYADVQELNCKKIKSLGPKRLAKKGPQVLDLSGKPLSPDKIKLLQVHRKKMLELATTRDKLKNPGKGLVKDTTPLDVNAYLAKNGQQMDLTQLIVMSNKNLKNFQFTPDMKIPARFTNYILVSDKGRPQIVRAEVMADVYNPETNQLVIPKGSIIVGKTQGFDADTGIMDLTFDKVAVGSGKIIAANFTVGSADGTMGLRGEVHDTRGKYLLGLFISSFTQGALSWFSQNQIQTFTQSTDATQALLGAGMQGGSDVASRISSMYAADLQGAARLFYVPKGVPIVLFPTD